MSHVIVDFLAIALALETAIYYFVITCTRKEQNASHLSVF